MTLFLSESETAKRACVSAKYLKKLRCVGGGPPFIKVGGGRRVVYDAADVDAWLAGSKYRSTSEVTERRGAESGAA